MPAPRPLVVSLAAARRFHRRALGLDAPHPTVADALQHHGYVQIDPINVCGRMHDLILRNRVANYRVGDLMRHLHGDKTPAPAGARTAFEHHLPDTGVLLAFPLEAWPHLLAAMRARTRRSGAWSGRLTPRERALAPTILAESENPKSEIENSAPPRLLAPLDPLIYDRRVTQALWSFAYTWEVYTPPAKRVRGYYALPILAGTEIVGHVDPKADRVSRRLLVTSQAVALGRSVAAAVDELAVFLGLRRSRRTAPRRIAAAGQCRQAQVAKPHR